MLWPSWEKSKKLQIWNYFLCLIYFWLKTQTWNCVCAALRYPADVKTFTHSGMKGAWERERAGQRMKLRQPETWERLLSLEGNNSTTWEKLIGPHPVYSIYSLEKKKSGLINRPSIWHCSKILLLFYVTILHLFILKPAYWVLKTVHGPLSV